MTRKETARRLLFRHFNDHGYVRVPNLALRARVGSNTYKKGYEARFVVADMKQVEQVRAALRALGFTPGRTFEKGSKIVVPVYGRDAVDFFQAKS